MIPECGVPAGRGEESEGTVSRILYRRLAPPAPTIHLPLAGRERSTRNGPTRGPDEAGRLAVSYSILLRGGLPAAALAGRPGGLLHRRFTRDRPG